MSKLTKLLRRLRFWVKTCPKCGADLYENRDSVTPYDVCLQCGHHLI